MPTSGCVAYSRSQARSEGVALYPQARQNYLFRKCSSASTYFVHSFQVRPLPARGSDKNFHFGILATSPAGLATCLVHTHCVRHASNVNRIEIDKAHAFKICFDQFA